MRAARRLVAAILILVTLVACREALAGKCRSDSYVVRGRIVDAGGNAVPRAVVYLLLDKVSQKKFMEQGFRARAFSADASGHYVASIDCGAEATPSPCAAKPKHLTVAAERRGHGSKLKVLAMKDLEIAEVSGVCTIDVPDFRLSSGL